VLLLLVVRSCDLLCCAVSSIARIALFRARLAVLRVRDRTTGTHSLPCRPWHRLGVRRTRSLSLDAVTFPEGKVRNRAMGVYAACPSPARYG